MDALDPEKVNMMNEEDYSVDTVTLQVRELEILNEQVKRLKDTNSRSPDFTKETGRLEGMVEILTELYLE